MPADTRASAGARRTDADAVVAPEDEAVRSGAPAPPCAATTDSASASSKDSASVPGRTGTDTPAPSPPPDPDATKLSPGEPGHGRMRLALFAAGLSTFALLYSTQALLPEISHALHAAPDQASWTVSGATVGLAVAVLPLAALSERFGRRRMLTVSLTVAVALALVIPFAPNLATLITLRTLQGAAVAGVPASAMAFLSDEVRARHLVGAVGLFVAGNSVGGMSGRILTGWVTEAWGWRAGLLAVALTSLLCAVAFRLLVPPARHFTPSSVRPRQVAATVGAHLRNPLLVRLYAIGLLFMTVFGAVYTVIGYRLVAAPFGLSQGLVGSIFVIYLVGTLASSSAGRLNARLGRRGTLYLGIGTTTAGLLVSLADTMVAVAAGLVLITAGFFAGHAVASGSVSQTATHGTAQASAIYQMSYYIGSSAGGALGAVAFATAGWTALVLLALCSMLLATAITAYATYAARGAPAPGV